MVRTAVLLLAFAALAGADRSIAGTSDTTGCLASAGDLERVPDCMRMGRHVRVGSSISRGTATLHGGMTPTGADQGLAGDDAMPRVRRDRIHVQGVIPGLFGITFAR